MLATAVMYRAVNRLYNQHVAVLRLWFTVAFACVIFLSLYTRSYIITLFCGRGVVVNDPLL